ncbi:hypothetical protein QE370_002520 [Aeromicrobium sp. SORGH_AS981]|nr:hypothetical protein [Aeromicrobium sp. SORGH_AS_0981]
MAAGQKSDTVSGGGRTSGLSLDLRVRGCGFSFGWGCAGAASTRPALRKGLDRAAGSGGGAGSRAVACVGRKNLRLRVPSVDLQPSERSTGGRSTADGARRGNDAPFSWTVPREGRSAAHPTPKCTQASSFVRLRLDASALVTGSRSRRRILGLQHTNAASCVHPERNPQPETPTQRPPSRPVEALSETTPSAGRGSAPARRDLLRQRTSEGRPPAAAHQQDETPCGSAPARRDPLRQRTSKTRPPAAAHQQDVPPPAAHEKAQPPRQRTTRPRPPPAPRAGHRGDTRRSDGWGRVVS